MKLLLSLLQVCSILLAVSSASVKYDQSQTGEYNVQIHLKNLELYALLDESILNAEQYDYDYADLTEKPPKPTSPPPPENNLECVEMTKYGVVYRKNSTKCQNTSTAASFVGSSSSSPSSSAKPSTMTILLTSGTSTSTTEKEAQSTSSPNISTVEVGTFTLKKCGVGYFRDNSGRCRRIRKPHLPFLHMIHTPGVIKSFNGDLATKLPSTTPSTPQN